MEQVFVGNANVKIINIRKHIHYRLLKTIFIMLNIGIYK